MYGAPLMYLSCWLALLISLLVKSGQGIGCFICDSLNNSNRHCHDPFHPAHNLYQDNCRQGKHGIRGLFPARFCVKISGRRMRDNVDLVIRRCTLERFTETDHKIGLFEWNGDLYEGIMGTCKTDGCNGGPPATSGATMTTVVAMATGVVALLLGRW